MSVFDPNQPGEPVDPAPAQAPFDPNQDPGPVDPAPLAPQFDPNEPGPPVEPAGPETPFDPNAAALAEEAAPEPVAMATPEPTFETATVSEEDK